MNSHFRGKTQWQMFLLVSAHQRWYPPYGHSVSMQSSINRVWISVNHFCEYISHMEKRTGLNFGPSIFVYLPLFISQILDLIHIERYFFDGVTVKNHHYVILRHDFVLCAAERKKKEKIPAFCHILEYSLKILTLVSNILFLWAILQICIRNVFCFSWGTPFENIEGV